ncbi:CoA transferase [Dehalococcoidia bacterium]|nr:CoA transferase [Dehalococcoidia bacterium]
MPGALDGVKVLDLTRILAGPFCTMILGDLGAEVVKVERPEGGDTARGNGPFIGDLSAYFLSVNRGKKSVTLDLSSPQGQEILVKLAVQSDVLVENFVPGAMRKFGLDYASLKERNPRLVYCSVSGFGQYGPYAKRPALDVIVQGMGGIMSITGEPGGSPIRPGASYGDISAGLYAVIGILSALFERAESGEGQYVDISMLDCQVAVQENAFSRYLATGEVPKPLGTRHPVVTPFQAFETQNDWIVVAIFGGYSDQWALFCAAIDRTDLIEDPDYATGWERTQHYDSLEPILNTALKQKTGDEWLEIFSGMGIACGPVNSIDKVVGDAQVVAREMIVDGPSSKHGPVKLINTPLKLSRTPGLVNQLSPDLGEDTTQILTGLGLSREQIDGLRLAGIV